jgi:NAD(P)-dependent dehydrogenase (short-subunit alcohol dehydrogenase family)
VTREAAVIVTGALGGIGRALCSVFRSQGCRVVGTDKTTSGEPTADVLPIDLSRICSDPAYFSVSVDALQKALGDFRLRALINNAAVQITRPVEELTGSDWQATFQVNVIAPFLLSQAFLRRLQADKGCVVNIVSIHATLTKPGFAAYATSKAALAGLTRSLAVELGTRVRVNAIAPAAVDTPMLREGFAGRPHLLDSLGHAHPIGRIATAEEIATAAAFLASDQAEFITGTVLHVDGGISARLHDPV